MDLGLALSGGGFRATAYHLGVLARLAQENRLEEITHLSTVSGGSLCVGLVYALHHFAWPSSQDFRARVAPQARQHLTEIDFQTGLLWRVLRRPWRLFETKADDLSAELRRQWGVTLKLNELPDRPRWMINATCYETGKNWRFERFRMGDYVFGYTSDPPIDLSDALAASAGFPGLIGPLVLNTDDFRWFNYWQDGQPDSALESPMAALLESPMESLAESVTELAPDLVDPALAPGAAAAPSQAFRTEPVQPAFKRVHLWDGGVYDNHGLEALHDFGTGWRQGIDFLIVSDGSGKAKPERYRLGAGVFLRIITGVMMDQIRSLRTRAVLERIKHHGDQGVFLTIGSSSAAIVAGAGKARQLAPLAQASLSIADARRAQDFPTVIRKLTGDEFELLFRHGFEVANSTLHTYYPDLFGHIAYHATDWR